MVLNIHCDILHVPRCAHSHFYLRVVCAWWRLGRIVSSYCRSHREGNQRHSLAHYFKKVLRISMKGLITQDYVYPDDKGWHRCGVLVFDNKKNMLKFCRKHKLPSHSNQEALCTTWVEKSRRDFGFMVFYLGGITQEIITHECGHAAFGYLVRKGINMCSLNPEPDTDLVTDVEEMYCEALGRMANDVAAVYLDIVE